MKGQEIGMHMAESLIKFSELFYNQDTKKRVLTAARDRLSECIAIIPQSSRGEEKATCPECDRHHRKLPVDCYCRLADKLVEYDHEKTPVPRSFIHRRDAMVHYFKEMGWDIPGRLSQTCVVSTAEEADNKCPQCGRKHRVHFEKCIVQAIKRGEWKAMEQHLKDRGKDVALRWGREQYANSGN